MDDQAQRARQKADLAHKNALKQEARSLHEQRQNTQAGLDQKKKELRDIQQ